MKILYITAFPPNTMTAGQNYSRQVINDLSKDNIIDLIYFSYPNHKIINLDKVNSIIEIPINKRKKFINSIFLFFLHPFFTSRFSLKIFFYIKKKAKESDLVYFDYSQVFIYSLFIKHPFKCMYCHDVIYQKYERISGLNRLILPFLRFTEKLILSSGKYIFCPSKKDMDLLKKVHLINSYSIDQYINIDINAFKRYKVNYIKNKYVFLGAWNRKENSDGLIWFLENVFPYIKKEIYFEVIGQGMPENLIEKLQKTNNINYLGFVEDFNGIILESIALIAPIFQGAGVKVKVLETLATGTPVIGTTLAFEGIEVQNIKDGFCLCEKPEDFIKKINDFEKWTISMKEDLQKRFASEYPKNKVVNYINHFVNGE
jgi:glycosyltransferase involved in cell wall biosynthesis